MIFKHDLYSTWLCYFIYLFLKCVFNIEVNGVFGFYYKIKNVMIAVSNLIIAYAQLRISVSSFFCIQIALFSLRTLGNIWKFFSNLSKSSSNV